MARDGYGLHPRKGFWQFRVKTPDGKWPYKNTGVRVEGRQTKPPQAAIDKKTEMLAKLDFNAPAAQEEWTIERAGKDWLKELEAQANNEKAKRTVDSYRSCLNILTNFMGAVKLKDIGIQQWKWYVAERKAGGKRTYLAEGKAGTTREVPYRKAKNTTINKELLCLSLLLKRAKLWRKLEEDFEARHDSPMLAKLVSSPRTAIRPAEFHRLVKTALTNDDWIVTLCAEVLAYSTGLRSEEIKQQQLRDIHMKQEDCWADCRDWSIGPHIRVTDSKTEAGEGRTVPMGVIAQWAMGRLLVVSARRGAMLPEHHLLPRDLSKHTKKTDPLYARRFEGFDPTLHQVGWKSSWKSLRRKAQLQHVHFHDLRHSFKTYFRKHGKGDTKMAMLIMGHLGEEMSRYYDHPEEGEIREAIERMDAADVELLKLLNIDIDLSKMETKGPKQ